MRKQVHNAKVYCRTKCAYRAQCVGVHRSYIKHMGAPDIAPITSPRPVALSGDRFHPVASVDERIAAS